MSPRHAVEHGRTLWTMPIGAVPISNSKEDDMPATKPKTIRTDDIEALTRMIVECAGDVAREMRAASPSPSTLAALAPNFVATRQTLAQRLDRSETIQRLRSGVMTAGTPEEIMSRREFANDLRIRTTVTNATGAVVPQWTKDTADLPEQGGRLAGLFRIREAPEPAIGISEETGSRAAVVLPEDFNAALPESAATYTRTELTDSRFGAYMHPWKSILSDSQALADALDFVLGRDMGRQIDVELLSGDGTGTAYGKHFTGLANLGLTAQDATALGSRWVALLTAAGAIRTADWLGPITTILHPTDFVDLAIEKAATTNAPVFAVAVGGLAKLGADNFVLSALQTPGTAWIGSWSEFGTIYVREAPTLAVAQSDQDDFTKGLVKLKVEGRLAFRTHYTSAGQKITNF